VGPAFDHFRCGSCGATFDSGPIHLTCPRCGEGTLEAVYDYSELSISQFQGGRPSVWNYQQLLPLERPMVTLEEGGTPLLRCDGLFKSAKVYVKDESRNPTSSFADRGSTLALTQALHYGERPVACATDGDTGASVAAYASKAKVDCTVFASSSAEIGKLLQTLVYGARVIRTHGNFRNAIARCESACRSEGYRNLTLETDPYAIEGEKTTAFEISQQLGWESPDFVIVPVGTGTNIYSIWKGYRELKEAGILSRTPKMVAVQAESCAPVVSAYREGREIRNISASTSIATSIAIGDPINGEVALTALRESGGVAYSLADHRMLEALNLLGAKEGIFAEPASAATISAAQDLLDDGTADVSDSIVCIITGSGLKVPDGIARSLKQRLASVDDLLINRKAFGPLGRTKVEILEVLSSSPDYGYSMWRRLDVRFGETLSLQAVYQHLKELENMGLVSGKRVDFAHSQGKRRRYFTLTTNGKRILSSLDSIRASFLSKRSDSDTS